MCPSEIDIKQLNEFSIQQSSVGKKGSFKRWYLSHLFANPIIFIALMLITCILTVVDMMILVLVGTIVNLVVSWIGNISAGLSLLNVYILRIIILFLIRFVFHTMREISGSWLAWDASKQIKNEFIDQIQNKPMKFHDSVRTGEMISLATFDVAQIVDFIFPGLLIIFNILSALFFSVFFFIGALNAHLLFICLIPFLIAYIWTFIKFNRKMAPVSESFMRKYGVMSTAAQENINAAKVVRAFAEESYEQEKFHVHILDIKETWRRRLRTQAQYFPSLILNIAISVLGVIGIFLIIYGNLTIGTLISFNGFLVFFLYMTFDLPFGVTLYNGALAGARRIYSMENKEEGEETKKRNIEIEKVQGHIVFENVTFQYPTSIKPILKNISFTVTPGQTIAIVGPTGSGKSSLTQLLLRPLN
jgi:ATP-binding cassette subfamily B protein